MQRSHPLSTTVTTTSFKETSRIPITSRMKDSLNKGWDICVFSQRTEHNSTTHWVSVILAHVYKTWETVSSSLINTVFPFCKKNQIFQNWNEPKLNFFVPQADVSLRLELFSARAVWKAVHKGNSKPRLVEKIPTHCHMWRPLFGHEALIKGPISQRRPENSFLFWFSICPDSTFHTVKTGI